MAFELDPEEGNKEELAIPQRVFDEAKAYTMSKEFLISSRRKKWN